MTSPVNYSEIWQISGRNPPVRTFFFKICEKLLDKSASICYNNRINWTSEILWAKVSSPQTVSQRAGGWCEPVHMLRDEWICEEQRRTPFPESILRRFPCVIGVGCASSWKRSSSVPCGNVIVCVRQNARIRVAPRVDRPCFNRDIGSFLFV